MIPLLSREKLIAFGAQPRADRLQAIVEDPSLLDELLAAAAHAHALADALQPLAEEAYRSMPGGRQDLTDAAEHALAKARGEA